MDFHNIFSYVSALFSGAHFPLHTTVELRLYYLVLVVLYLACQLLITVKPFSCMSSTFIMKVFLPSMSQEAALSNPA